MKRKRIGIIEFGDSETVKAVESLTGTLAYKRPKLAWFNLVLTFASMVCLILAFMSQGLSFMMAIALLVNYPNLKL